MVNTLVTILFENGESESKKWEHGSSWEKPKMLRIYAQTEGTHIFPAEIYQKQTNQKWLFFNTQLQGQALDVCDILYSSAWWWYTRGRPLIGPESLSR